MKNFESHEEQALEDAKKVFEFWYSVLLETTYMDDLESRKDFQRAIRTITETQEKIKEV